MLAENRGQRQGEIIPRIDCRRVQFCGRHGIQHQTDPHGIEAGEPAPRHRQPLRPLRADMALRGIGAVHLAGRTQKRKNLWLVLRLDWVQQASQHPIKPQWSHFSMKLSSPLAVLGLLLMSAMPAAAEAVTDCPLRDAPFSASTPLIDILLSPAARAVVEEELGTSFNSAPPRFAGTEPPTFAAILTLKEFSGFAQQPAEAVDRAIAALENLPVTDADKIVRCARYDNDVPQLDVPDGRPKILVFEKINGFKDVPSVDAAHAALTDMASRNSWTMVFSEKGGAMSAEFLGQFDAVIWNNISGDVLTLSQRQSLRDFVEGGGGFVGLHGTAGDPVYFWDWYVDTLIGARFAGHPRDPQFQEARVIVEDSDHAAAADLPAEWVMKDEWYSFRTNPRDSGARIIARLDEDSYDLDSSSGRELHMGDDHPIAWSKIIGKGRSFYSAIGHLPETYTHPLYNKMIEDAVAWAARIEDCDCEAE